MSISYSISRISSILLSLVLLLCCSRTSYDIISSFPEDEYYVSLEEAETIAVSLLSEKGVIPDTKVEGDSIKAAFSINDKEDSSLLYVINYNCGGFAIISADTRLMPVQAYSPTGCFNDDENSYPLGLKIWIEGIEMARNTIKEKSGTQSIETKLAWMEFNADSFNLTSISTKSIRPIDIGEVEVDSLVGPLISDSWHQGSPYNDSLEVCTHYNNGAPSGNYQPVVGCGPLAISRVMRFNQWPSSYPWSNMHDNIPQTPETISFIRDVHYAVKDYSENIPNSFVYGVDSGLPATGISSNYPIDDFLREQYGYPAAITEEYSFSHYGVIRREIFDHNLPCIIFGATANMGGHFWICDGYRYRFSPSFDPDGSFIGGFENNYLHFCWGWPNRDNDGWFLNNNVGGYNYSMYFTHRISPVDYWTEE